MVYDVHRLSEFDIVGITETELGDSILDRMANIALLRKAMDAAGIIKPLHVFGSLDPICTPLYFLAGADIFDGLSWIRFAYWKDVAIYHKNRSPMDFGTSESEYKGLVRSCAANLYYLSDLKRRLDRYLIDMDLKRLGKHVALFEQAVDDLHVKLRGVV